MLDRLPFHRPDNAEPYGTGDAVAYCEKQEDLHGAGFGDAESRECRPEDRREVRWGLIRSCFAAEVCDALVAKNSLHRRQQCTALRAAGSIGHVVAQKQIAFPIDMKPLGRISKRGHDKRRRRKNDTAQLRVKKIQQSISIGDNAVLIGSFEPARMSESTAWKR